MKRVRANVLSVAIAVMFLVFTTTLNAWANRPKQRGSWVIERNATYPMQNIIRFYNDKNELVYEETLVGVQIDVKNPQTVRKLNKAVRIYLKKGVVIKYF
ncbi:MAG: hypothetical protein NZ551_07465 [Microscillaceae bacterium]|nr:hypothetical protein [Microscillaceae bacterium]MDW8461033.1 hypothetical protein [Cytophagales bacterium]